MSTDIKTLEQLSDALEKLSKTVEGVNRREQRERNLERAAEFPLWKPITDFSKVYHHPNELTSQHKGLIELAKAADSTSVGPLIRQDLEAEIYEVYVKVFPAFEMFEKIPANGLVHAYNRETAYGGAPFMSELGTVTDDSNTYQRLTTNIGIAASRRGISLKAMYAVAAGGMAYDPEAREVAGGLRAIRHTVQTGIFRLQTADNTSTLDTSPNGKYDANAFNGLRYVIKNVSPGANSIAVVPNSPQVEGAFPVTQGVRDAANKIIDAGGEPSAIFATVTGKEKLIAEQMPIERFNNTIEVVPGLRVPRIAAGEAELPIITIPGDSLGTWIDSTPHTWTDLVVADMNTVKLAYLGSPVPQVFEIPIGTDGSLRKLYIPFAMYGLVTEVPEFLARTEVQLA